MNDITLRFLEVFKTLVSEGKIKGQKDFASAVNISNSMMTEIIKGRSNVGLSAIKNLVLVFGIDANWLLTGQSTPQKKQSTTENPKTNEVEDERNELRKDLLDTLRENKMLREEIAQLKNEKRVIIQDKSLPTQ